MARDFNGTSQWIDVADKLLHDPESEDFSVHFLFKADDTTTSQQIAGKGNWASTLEGWKFLLTGGSLYVTANASNDATDRGSQNIAFTDTSSWHALGLRIDATANTIEGFLDGTNTGWSDGGAGPSTNTITGDINSTSPLRLGARETDINWFNGQLAEFAIWKGAALNDAEFAALGVSLYSPLMIRPSLSAGYWPIAGRISPEPDIIFGNNLALTAAPAYFEHPRIIYPAMPQIITAPAAAAAGAGIRNPMGGPVVLRNPMGAHF